MNPKYFSLPEEKQSAILNAGFHVRRAQFQYGQTGRSEPDHPGICHIP